jgi:tetratricopeptide (TPR) repeat protein
MAKEKSEVSVKEAEKAKKSKGKGKQLQGDFFKRNKELITWALAIAFAITCIGFFGIARTSSLQKKNQTTKSPQEEQIDKIAENIKYWKERVQEAPQNAINVANLGYAYQESADSMLRAKGKDLKPEDRTKYEEQKRLAVENYTKALSLDKSYAFAANNLADMYIDEGKNDKAIEVLDSVLKEVQKSAGPGAPSPGISAQDILPVNEKLCKALIYSGKTKEGLVLGEKVLKEDPGNYEVRLYMAKAYYGNKDLENAISYLDESQQILEARARSISDMEMRRSLIQTLIEIKGLQGDIFVSKKDYPKAGDSYKMAKALVSMNGNDQKTSLEIDAKLQKIAQFLPKEPLPEAIPSKSTNATPVPVATMSVNPQGSLVPVGTNAATPATTPVTVPTP